MLQALVRTITEILDSKKAAYSFIAALGASVLHLYFDVSIQDALLLVSPLGVATISQAHVDAAAAKNGKSVALQATPVPVELPVPIAPSPPSSNDSPASAEAKTDG